jgi:hypothetical protein
VDTTFKQRSAEAALGWIDMVLVEPNDKLFIGSARLLPEGTLDPTFDPALRVHFGAALQPDGKYLVARQDHSPFGTVTNALARLNKDGSRDPSFDPGTGANREISVITFQPDGRVLIGGGFSAYQSVRRSRVARLLGSAGPEEPRVLACSWLPSGRFQFISSSEPGRSYTVQSSSDLVTWSDVETIVPDNSTFVFTEPAGAHRRFFRVSLR